MSNKLKRTEFELYLSKKWQIQSSEKIKTNGKEISHPEFATNGWYLTSVPSTILAALIENGVYKNPYFGLNLKNISTVLFKVPWWYRKEFDLENDQLQKHILLACDGINYCANIWLNGNKIASNEDVAGTFRRFEFDISEHVKKGKNVLAIELFPPEPGQFSIGFVDWNPVPPDQNMGVFRPVALRFNNGVSIDNPFVKTEVNVETLKQALLTVSAELFNHTNEPVAGVLKGKIENIVFEQLVLLKAKEKKLVTFNPEEFEQLNIEQPRLWWCNNLGDPNLYKLKLSFELHGQISDQSEVTFGIREIEDYFNEQGHRGYKINGKKVLIKGGGWTDDIFLQDTPESLEAQIQYVQHLNLNTIRLEGFWGKDQTLYHLCDKYGILIMVGWSCHWEHEEYLGKAVDEKYGGVLTAEDIDIVSKSFQDQIIWLRNHPSIFVWTVGSDKLPHPDLEKKYVEILEGYDGTRNYLASTGGMGSEQGVIVDIRLESEISGSTGVKMLGPYAYTPPIYWHTNKNLGGAYGFNTETGPGAQVPLLESLKKMIPEDHLWPIDDYWHYHCARNVFSTLNRYIKAINERYGEADFVEEFVKKAQLINYELMRPMFEAFQANKFVSTGIIQWMLNTAWPKMYWQLYDYYLMPNGAFYGTKKACQPLHLLYRYGLNDIYLVNDLLKPMKDLKSIVRVFDIDSKEKFSQTLNVAIEENQSKQIFQLPEIKDLSTTYFLDMRLMDSDGEEIDNNFYWLSTKADVLDYETKAGEWSFYTASKEYADFTLLNDLTEAQIAVKHHFEKHGDKQKVFVELDNKTNNIAFFIELNITGSESGESIVPVFWVDNYISLLPGEKRKINATFFNKDLKEYKPELKISGWNFPPQK